MQRRPDAARAHPADRNFEQKVERQDGHRANEEITDDQRQRQDHQ